MFINVINRQCQSWERGHLARGRGTCGEPPSWRRRSPWERGHLARGRGTYGEPPSWRRRSPLGTRASCLRARHLWGAAILAAAEPPGDAHLARGQSRGSATLPPFPKPSNLQTSKPPNLQTFKPPNLQTLKPSNLQTFKLSNLYFPKQCVFTKTFPESCVFPFDNAFGIK